jgi:ABC-type spermidine/putrescine transport system permease subunit II
MATETGEPTEPSEPTGQAVGDRFLDRRRTEWLLQVGLYGFAVLMMLFLWAPLLVIVFLSFAESPTLLPFEGFTLEYYLRLPGEPGLSGSVAVSFLVATVSAAIATALGVLASFALTRYRFRLREIYRTFGIIPMIIPGVILGVGLRFYFRLMVDLDLGFLTTVLTHSLYGLPFVLLIVTARLYTFDESLEEAARDLGADPITTFRDVTLPVIAPAVGAGFLFAWVRSFEDYIRALFVSGIGIEPLTQWMFGKITKASAENLLTLNAVSTLVVLAIAVALALAMNVGNVSGYVAGTHEDIDDGE